MPPRTVERIRAAVSSGSFAEADRLLGVFRAEMQTNWEAATSPEERARIAADVNSLLEWARTATLAARSHAQRKLIHLTRRNAYAGIVGSPTVSV
jgi:hypothetical protein